MRAKTINYKIIFLVFILFAACSDNKIEIEKLAKVYVDLSVAEDYYSDSDSLEIKKKEIFRKYSISESNYKESFIKFGSNKEKWDEFYKLADTYLDTLKSNLKNSRKK